MRDLKKEIRRRIRSAEEEILSTTRDLVRIPSENTPPNGKEVQAQRYVMDALEGSGISTRLIDLSSVPGLPEHEAYFPGREYRDRPNVAAVYPGRGKGRSLLLSGHIDTMPVGDAPWRHDPLGGRIEDGRLYGRGAYDMKGGIAAMLTAVKTIAAAGVELGGDLLFETVVDEEHAGCNGTLANRLIGHNADAAILPEPSQMDIYPAHKGFRIVHLTVHGSSGMSFSGETLENPVEHVGRLIEAVKGFRRFRRDHTTIPALYRDDPDPVPVFMPKLQAGEFSFRIPMTIPDRCTLEVYWQTMPGEGREEVEREFFSYLEDWYRTDEFFGRNRPDAEFSLRWMPGTQTAADHPIVETARSQADWVTGRGTRVRGAPYPCDLFVFNLFGGMPSIVLGPGGANAHGAEEYVLVRDLVDLSETLACIALEWCGTA